MIYLVDILFVKGDEFFILDWKTNKAPIRFEGGYWVKHYFNAVNEIHLISGKDNANYINNLNDTSYHGIYFSLSASM